MNELLGYCASCDKLVTLRRVDRRPARPVVDYYPIQHDGCDGHKRAL